MRDLTGGQDQVDAQGQTVREVIAWLEQNYPGMKARLCDGDKLRRGVAVSIDGEVSPKGIRASVEATSEVHFLPAIHGGSLHSPTPVQEHPCCQSGEQSCSSGF